MSFTRAFYARRHLASPLSAPTIHHTIQSSAKTRKPTSASATGTNTHAKQKVESK